MIRSFLRYSLNFFVFFSLSSAYAHSLNSYYCLAHHNTIRLGDSPTKVKAACGEPTQRSQGQSAKKQIATYSFMHPPKNNSTTNSQRPKPSPNLYTKLDVMVELDNSIITAIRVGNTPKLKTRACGGLIHIGDSTKQLIKRCGRPTTTHWVHQTQQQLNRQQQWEYYFGDYAQSLQLQFTNNRLSHISFGAMGGRNSGSTKKTKQSS